MYLEIKCNEERKKNQPEEKVRCASMNDEKRNM
jgi:hypothetical protein